MKSINIKGKNYNPVNERIKEFHKLYKNGSIVTEILKNEDGRIIMRSTVTPDVDKPQRFFTGHAEEWQDDPKSMVNKTSYVENCETSCIGRALGSLGIGIEDSFASSNEVDIAEKKLSQLKCQDCGEEITWASKKYSEKKYGKCLCYNCQKKIEVEKSVSNISNNTEEVPF